MANKLREQSREDIFALDIGTRSIIGVLGRLEGSRLHVTAIEKENHGQRTMLDGQIEDIAKVAAVAQTVVQRLENTTGIHLTQVCVAAAGRALKSERASFRLELPVVRQIGEDLVGQLESGAVFEAEKKLAGDGENDPDTARQNNQYYMVGYSIAGYRLDGYPLSSLRDHSGQELEADVIATFLPREVVESLYAVVSQIGLEVASLTLEPIASLNAAIPQDIRLLNLVLVDIGAGTSDIAVCRDGSVVGYTMATIAGDEITELFMRSLLVDFDTGERLKMSLAQDASVSYTDILGLPQDISAAELRKIAEPSITSLARELARRISELNGKVPSAVFLAGGGSKLAGLREKVSEELKIDANRVALAGNHFSRSAYAEKYDLNDPEYATPLGIAISAALGLINDSYQIQLNGEPAKLFRSGSITIRDILMMNGYRYADLIGRTGANLSVTLNGERQFFRGRLAIPPQILLNDQPAELTDLVHAGDTIFFVPAKPGEDASRTLRDLLGKDFFGDVTVNGVLCSMSEYVHTGDDIWADRREPLPGEVPPQSQPSDTLMSQNTPTDNTQNSHTEQNPIMENPAQPVLSPDMQTQHIQAQNIQTQNMPQMPNTKSPGIPLRIIMNGQEMLLPPKSGGEPYYLMDMLQYADLDFDHLEHPVELLINGVSSPFAQKLLENDDVIIR